MASHSTLDSFHTVLITGGGGGLGKAMTEYLVKHGKKVIIAGRTESNLKEAAKETGAVAYYVLDTGDTASISSFVQKITKEHPDLDGLINNAGVQRPLNIASMPTDELLSKADNEISINISGPLHLSLELLPHFRSKKTACIMNVSSILGFIPFSVINPVYNATKAWVHFFTMNLRTHLKETNVKIVEIAPPAVGTDLHREREDPDDNKPHKNKTALSVEQFMSDLEKGWQQGTDTVSAGPGLDLVERWYKEFGDDYKGAADSFSP